MSTFTRILSAVLSFLLSLFGISAPTVADKAEDFRITAYIVMGNVRKPSDLDPSHLSQLTDVILFSMATFNTEGEVILAEDFDGKMDIFRSALGDSTPNVYLNLIGPGAVSGSTWEEQMDSQSLRHEAAFASGKLEGNILAVLQKYGFDGIFFDYEYPNTQPHWDAFSDYLVKLDGVLGDDYLIGTAISAWNCHPSKKAIAVTDLATVMAYDIWDNQGNHSPFGLSKSTMRKARSLGYDKKQLDMGIPFYARPTTQEAYWYGYNGWYDKLDEKGLCVDPDTGLTFSFNTPELVAKKTEWAIKQGYGGIMVWHYGCDVPADNSASLFNAAYNTKTEMMQNDLLF